MSSTELIKPTTNLDTNGNSILATTTTPTQTTTTTVNNNCNANDKVLEQDLSILEHLKSIEKINDQRRNFLNKTLITTAEVNTSSETSLLLSKQPNNDVQPATSQLNDTKANGGVADNDIGHVSEHATANGNGMHTIREEETPTTTTNVSSGSVRPLTIKYATLPMPMTPSTIVSDSNTILRSPITPPPKPPMLSRTRSIGPGDNVASVAMATKTTKSAPIILPPKILTTNDIIPASAPLSVSKSSVAIASLPITSNEQQMISAKHYERLVEELRCPGCAEAMKAPILLCKSGHSICEQCTRILMICPLCKEAFTTQRSRTVEALCAKAHFRCSHSNGGCPVRMPIALLDWHERQCIYKPMKCFMGRVWGDCQWQGREVQWKEHLEAEHGNKMFNINCVDLIWNLGVKQKPLTGYYVFQVYDEMFNFYEIYDKERVLFTMTCTSPNLDMKYNFAYEVTMIHPCNEALAIAHKFPVHSEYDSDILQDGTCVSIAISDLSKFIDDDKLLHYRVQVLAVKSPRIKSTILPASVPLALPNDVDPTQYEGGNLKGVPTDMIITRKTAMATTNENSTNITNMSDADFEAYLIKKWSTPQLNFNRKYLKCASNENDARDDDESPISELGPFRNTKLELVDDKVSLCSTNISYTKKVSNTLRKSFRAFKTDLIEMKPFSKKSNSNSPEKVPETGDRKSTTY